MPEDSDRIHIKTEEDLVGMRRACRLAAETLRMAGGMVKEGVSTLEINDACAAFMKANQAVSATMGYRGYPKHVCTSINEVVCHGIPKAKDRLKNGDLVNVDITVILGGWYGDCSRTFAVGSPSAPARLLLERSERAMEIGIEAVRPGEFMGTIGERIEAYLKPFGYGIVRALGGHGIGRHFHEGPFVPHHRQGSRGVRMKPGMTFTIEPMINEGHWDVYVDEADGWTVWTKDGSLSAQFEHTVLVTPTGVEILTRLT